MKDLENGENVFSFSTGYQEIHLRITDSSNEANIWLSCYTAILLAPFLLVTPSIHNLLL